MNTIEAPRVDHAPEKGRMVSVGCGAGFGASEVRCWVERLTPKQITITEPLGYKAPSIAYPHCCYWNTVIFYVWPYQTKRDGISFQEWERVDYCFPCDSEAVVDGQRYMVGGGRVIRWRGQWWMRHNARLREPNHRIGHAQQ